MTNPIIKIINVQTGEEIERAMTKAETDEFNKANIQPQEVLDRKAEAASKATAKAELLAKLGITADEAALLLS
jgi:hypothetical protein